MPAGGAVVRALLLVAASQVPQTPTAPSPTGLILGRVVDAASGRPISGATVTLGGLIASGPATAGIPAPASQPRAVTSAGGQFVFRNLPKGNFSLTTTRPGYLAGAYGRRRPGGTPSTVQLDDGQRVGDVVIPMWRPVIISGTITDEAGDPLVAVGMRAFRRTFIAGRRRFMPAGIAMTDDRGMYRFNALTPGDYVVAFLSREVTMPATFEELRGAGANSNDKTSQTLMRGQVSIGAFGVSPSTGDGVQIGDTVRQVSMMGPVPPMSSEAAAPTYIYPTLFFPNAPTAARAAVMTLDSGQQRDAVDLSLHPVRAFRVSGTIVGPDGPAAMIPMRLVPAGDDSAPEIESAATMADGDGNFILLGATPGVTPGRYRLSASLAGARTPWLVRASSLGGQESLDGVVDVRSSLSDGVVTLTDRISELNGHGTPDTTVILFSTNPAQWASPSRRILWNRVGPDGGFLIRNVPPGDYNIVSVADIEPGQWTDPAYLQTLTNTATKVTIAEGEKKTLDLRAGGAV